MVCFWIFHKWRYDSPCHRTCTVCHKHQTRYKHVADDTGGYSTVDCGYYKKNLDLYKRNTQEQNAEEGECKLWEAINHGEKS